MLPAHKVKLRKRIADLALCLRRHRAAGKLIVFTYHALTDSFELDAEQLSVSLLLFSRQMGWLRELGYLVLPLREAVAKLREGRIVSPVISLTFDDGYRSTYTHAFPVLQRHGYPATVFLVPGVLRGTTPRTFMPDRFGSLLSWADAREMLRYGITFGAHGMTHRKLSRLADHEVEKEVGDSKRAIEEELSAEVTEFCYPYGSFDSFNRSSETILSRWGFEAICTTIAGHNRFPQDAARLKRLRMSWADDSIWEVRKQCLGAYNWYALYQRVVGVTARES
jgi:peptidoglycan/xylan/chitin deacetylase (PgdA/CDA1 family)